MNQSRIRLSIALGMFVISSSAVFAGTNSKISPDATAASSSSNVPVIIQYHTPPTTLETSLLSLLGGLVTSTLQTINALVVNVPHRNLNQIAADPNVTYISLDRTVTTRQTVTI